MAILGAILGNDFADIKPEDYTPVPAGEYVLQVTKSELCQTKDGTGQYIKLQFDIIAPAYQGRKLFTNLNIRNDNSMAEKIGKQQLKALVLAGHVQEPLEETEQLLGIIVKANVTVKDGSDGYDASNNVKGFKEYSNMPNAAIGTHQSAPKPSAPSFSKVYSAPAAGTASAPWNH